MTIAVCYISPEGVVFGADSTASLTVNPGGFHYFNHNQKIFEIGEQSTLALATWGLGGLTSVSHRTLVARLGDDLAANPASNVFEVADRWSSLFWAAYTSDPEFGPLIQRCQQLGAKLPFDAAAVPPPPNARTDAEENEFTELRMNLFVGFCVGGYIQANRTPMAYELTFDPSAGKPTPMEINFNSMVFRGAPNIIQRLIFGCDDELTSSIVNSPHWTGTSSDLAALKARHTLQHPILPIRDVVDFVHTCIHSTIKAFKFSNFSQVCGGPIELAVITTDRKFRWVRHKEWDSAISKGES